MSTGNKRTVALLAVALAVPALVVVAIHQSENAAVLVVSAPWINWAVYVLGFLMAGLVTAIGGRVMQSHSMLLLSMSFVYWALGCGAGALQSGPNPPITPLVALPYVRSLWLLGSVSMLVSGVGVLSRVVHITYEGDVVAREDA